MYSDRNSGMHPAMRADISSDIYSHMYSDMHSDLMYGFTYILRQYIVPTFALTLGHDQDQSLHRNHFYPPVIRKNLQLYSLILKLNSLKINAS